MATMIVLLIAVDAIILLLWDSNAPLRFVRKNIAYDRYGYLTESTGRCETESGDYVTFLAPLVSLPTLLLIAGNYLAYQVRNIATAFQESKYISIAMFSNLQVMALGLPVLFIVSDDAEIDYFVKCGIVFFNDFTVLMLIFLPKVIDKTFKLNMLNTEPTRTNLSSNAPISGSRTGSRTDVTGNAYVVA